MDLFQTEAENDSTAQEILMDTFAFPLSPDSFGRISCLIKREGRNFMLDVPVYVEENIFFIEQNGLPGFVFLAHRDDVADAEIFTRSKTR